MASFINFVRSNYLVSVLITTVFILTTNVNASVTTDLLLKSQVKLAQCRAQCLDKFIRYGGNPSDSACTADNNCWMCWDTCDFFNTNFSLWRPMCDNSRICFPGCQQSCGFHLKGTQSDALPTQFSLKFRQSLEITKKENVFFLTWPRPTGEKGKNTVYSVLKRNYLPGAIPSKWEVVNQTSELSVQVKRSMFKSSIMVDFKVIAVTGSRQIGQLANSYHMDNSLGMLQDATALTSGEMAAEERQNALKKQEPQVAASRLKLYLVNLQHNPHLASVDAVITWAAPGLTGNFLVTWEVKEGTFAITGHLYTDSTTVTLSLWPETTYSVQVELVSSSLGIAIRSEPLIINTNFVNKMDDSSVLASPVKESECMNTLVFISLGVIALLVAVIIVFVMMYRCCRKTNSTKYFDNKLQSLDAIRRKVILSPLPIDVENGISTTFTNPIATPSSSNLSEKMSAFRGFINESMVDIGNCDSLEPTSANSVIFTFPQKSDVTIHSVKQFQFGKHAIEKLLSSADDCHRLKDLENGDAVFRNDLSTDNLLTKAKCVRSWSTAI